MQSRRSLLLACAVMIGVTFAVVVYDLNRARRDDLALRSRKETPLPLMSVPSQSAETSSPEPLSDEGFARFAMLTETEEPITGDAALKPIDQPATLPESSGLQSIPLLTEEQRKQNLKAIGEVLPGLTADEQEFWLNETAGMTPQGIREMLALRSHIGELSENDLAQPSDDPAPIDDQTLAGTIGRARRIVLQNLANSESIGYREIQIVYTGDALIERDAKGLDIAGLKISALPGRNIETGNSLDVALRPEFFLQVNVNGGFRFTRYGRLKVLSNGLLGLDIAANAEIPLEPPVQIPRNAVEARITTSGHVECLTSENPEWVEVASLALFGFQSPENLTPASLGTYETTPACGLVVEVGGDASRTDCLAVGFLESSNVNWDAEKRELERLDWLLEQLRK